MLCVLLMVGVGFGCGSDDDSEEQPVITLTAIDCPVEDIQLSVVVTKRRDPSRTVTTATITVTCADEAVNNAELSVSFWGVRTRVGSTNEEGKLTVSQVTSVDTTGLEVTVTVEGSDGESEVVVTPVPAQ